MNYDGWCDTRTLLLLIDKQRYTDRDIDSYSDTQSIKIDRQIEDRSIALLLQYEKEEEQGSSMPVLERRDRGPHTSPGEAFMNSITTPYDTHRRRERAYLTIYVTIDLSLIDLCLSIYVYDDRHADGLDVKEEGCHVSPIALGRGGASHFEIRKKQKRAKKIKKKKKLRRTKKK